MPSRGPRSRAHRLVVAQGKTQLLALGSKRVPNSWGVTAAQWLRVVSVR